MNLETAVDRSAGQPESGSATPICRSLIATGIARPIFDHVQNQGVVHKLGQLSPLRRAGQPEALAQLALAPASGQSS